MTKGTKRLTTGGENSKFVSFDDLRTGLSGIIFLHNSPSGNIIGVSKNSWFGTSVEVTSTA
jgi:hypothetical protein